MKVSRVVLDTNVVCSALLFSKGRLVWLRHAWQSGEIVPLVSRESVAELLRVLAYPKFSLNADERDVLLADYLPFCETVIVPERMPTVPRCRDPHDDMFLRLALVGKAEALLTGDRDLLTLADTFSICICTAEVWRKKLSEFC